MMEVEKTGLSEKFVKPSEEEVEDLDIEKELEEEAASKAGSSCTIFHRNFDCQMSKT